MKGLLEELDMVVEDQAGTTERNSRGTSSQGGGFSLAPLGRSSRDLDLVV